MSQDSAADRVRTFSPVGSPSFHVEPDPASHVADDPVSVEAHTVVTQFAAGTEHLIAAKFDELWMREVQIKRLERRDLRFGPERHVPSLLSLDVPDTQIPSHGAVGVVRQPLRMLPPPHRANPTAGRGVVVHHDRHSKAMRSVGVGADRSLRHSILALHRDPRVVLRHETTHFTRQPGKDLQPRALHIDPLLRPESARLERPNGGPRQLPAVVALLS